MKRQIFIITHVDVWWNNRIDKLYNYLKHDHVVFTLEKGSEIIYLVFNDPRRFGYLIQTDHLKKLDNLGIEPLTDSFSGSFLWNKLKKTNTPVKISLMNSSLVVGIGNIYASEILFATKISPYRLSKMLSLEDCEKIVYHTKIILNNAIQLGGSTVSSFKSPIGVMGNFQNHHLVYRKKLCTLCGNFIKRIIQQTRSTYYCPNCQV